MSGPKTIDLPEDFDPHMTPWVEVNPKGGSSASVSSKINSHNNDALPYVVSNARVAWLSLGLSVGAMFLALIGWWQQNRSETHWRNDEVDIRELQIQSKYQDKLDGFQKQLEEMRNANRSK